ncbi:HP1 family phage holin [Candidatus Regiella insecticola]|uniref:HP1 family phage holin n=1 Tax=Candidatus Regiella insecticola TaxID=138073 RepID=UPI0022A757E6|nr:HP1 family phage holin [Candidatus Regiella insecticola]
MNKYTSPASFPMAWPTTAAGALTLQDWAVLTGTLLAVVTFLVNWYYKRKLINKLTTLGYHNKKRRRTK